jgi:hypothetical protein
VFSSTDKAEKLEMFITRRHLLAVAGAVVSAPAIVRAAPDKITLTVGTQDIALQETVKASKVLDGIPFNLQWATLPGPAAQRSGLYSKALDVAWWATPR